MKRSSVRVYIDNLEKDYFKNVVEGLDYVGFFEEVPSGSTVFLKPNLTFPSYRPGVMTSIECLTAVTETLIEKGYRVIIGEADSGGYNRFSIDEVFKKTGIQELVKRTGAETVNISFTEPEMLRVDTRWKTLSVPVPKLLLREIDAFVTLPVPKIHMNTLVSISIKNQWGCIQEPSERLKLHPYFAEVMYELNRSLPRSYSLVDGRYGLNRSGPMAGDPVELNWVLVSNDIVAADRLCCRLMQIEEGDVPYLNYFKKRGWWGDLNGIKMNRPIDDFIREKFYLKRQLTDYPGLICFKNRFLAWLGYHSPLAGFAHWLLYLFRKPFYDYEEERRNVRNSSKE